MPGSPDTTTTALRPDQRACSRRCCRNVSSAVRPTNASGILEVYASPPGLDRGPRECRRQRPNTTPALSCALRCATFGPGGEGKGRQLDSI